MNILLVTQEDPFYIPLFFKRFVHLYQNQNIINIAGIVIQESLGNSKKDLAKRMYEFYGARNFFRQGLRYAARILQEKSYTLGLTKMAHTISYYASLAKIPVLDFKSLNSRQAIDFVRENEIDLIVSVAASEIFKNEILTTPPLGCINLHNAPLPNYRGMLPNFWQMFHNESHSVLTIHTMTEKLDKGQIVYQLKTEIKPEYSFDDLAKVTKVRSADALWKVLKKYDEGSVKPVDMPDAKGSYFTFPNRDDVKKFKEMGKKLI